MAPADAWLVYDQFLDTLDALDALDFSGAPASVGATCKDGVVDALDGLEAP